MKTFWASTLIAMLGFSSSAVALDPVEAGFSVNGEPINPKCIQLMQTLISDKEISIREIILDECQSSNLAFEGMENQGRKGNKIYYFEDPNDGHSYFWYEVYGVTKSGLFAVGHKGLIGIYRISSEHVYSDILEHKTSRKQILTYLGNSWLPCQQGGGVIGNTLNVHAKQFDPSASTAQQCGKKTLTFSFDLGDIQ